MSQIDSWLLSPEELEVEGADTVPQNCEEPRAKEYYHRGDDMALQIQCFAEPNQVGV